MTSGSRSATLSWRGLMIAAACLITTVHSQRFPYNNLRGRAALPQDASPSGTSPASQATAAVLDVIQLSQPVLGPNGILGTVAGSASTNGASCQVTLMEHTFGSSYGKPFVGDYKPPSCIGSVNRVVMNFTVTSKGRQFDRLAMMFLGDSEVFRTSTAEPTKTGIIWTYVKDMSEYMYFWNTTQKLIFQLDNNVDGNYTGLYTTVLTASFFSAPNTPKAADMIIPISARRGNSSQGSVFSFPQENATNTVSFPQNANRAVFSISSAGQADEEFWWSNVLQSDNATYAAQNGTLFGNSPFREVQVHIDDQLAGVQWPFPVIFTGGVVPYLWSPIVGIDAYDLKEHEIDVTPWLPLLCDGKQHTFKMQVVGLDDDGKSSAQLSKTVGNDWFLTGKIFVWLDSTGSVTTGTPPSVQASPPIITVSQAVTQNSTGVNNTLAYQVHVRRNLTISATVKTQSGSATHSWSQTLEHTDDGLWFDYGNSQINNITTKGLDQSQGKATYTNTYSYPMFANTTATIDADENVHINAVINRSKNINIVGTPVHPSGLEAFSGSSDGSRVTANAIGSTFTTTQLGAAFMFLNKTNANNSKAGGSTTQTLRLGSQSGQGTVGMEPDQELYFRNTSANGGFLTADMDRVMGKSSTATIKTPMRLTVQSQLQDLQADFVLDPWDRRTQRVTGRT